ncbi:MAG: PAS domain-containing protein [Chloroflexaceae bacterium]|nr:PAS domain-containing protein [Chloroflexaceae bacterium]
MEFWRLSLSPATLAAQQNKTIVEEAMQTANNAWDENTIELQTTTTNDSIHTYVALPLMYNGYATGVLVLVRIGNPAMAFSVTIWSVLTVFTSLIASTCANMQLIARLQQHLERMDELLEQYTQQLKHSRDVLRTVFDNVPNGLVLLDAQERLLAANTTFCQQIIGQHPRELVGRPYATIWSLFRQRTDVHIAMQETLLTVSPESDRSVTMKQVHCTDGIGQQRWFEVTRHPIIDDTNTIMQYLERWREIIDMQIKNWA